MKWRVSWPFFGLLGLVLPGCGHAAPGATAPLPPRPTVATLSSAATPATSTARRAGLTFLTEPRAGRSPWITAMDHARTAIDLNDYLLTDSALMAALKAAAARGVQVEVLIAGNPYHDTEAVTTTLSAFQGSRVQVKRAPARFEQPYTYDHAKYLVVDPGTAHAVGIFGSPNGTFSAFSGHNAEDALETTTPRLIHALATVFQADWTGQSAGSGPRKVLMLSPGAGSALSTLLRESGPVSVMTEELGDAPFLYAALAAHRASARVLVPSSLSAPDRQHADALRADGVQVRALSQPYLHAKLILTASHTFLGSQNFSTVSMQANREVGIITGNAAVHTQALAWFDSLWAQATPWGSSPTPASHAQTPSASSAAPYISDGDSPAQVRALWGPPTSERSTTYHGTAETEWIYATGRVYFVHDRVVAVSRQP